MPLWSLGQTGVPREQEHHVCRHSLSPRQPNHVADSDLRAADLLEACFCELAG